MTIEELKKLIENDEHRQLELKKTTGELKDGMHSTLKDGFVEVFPTHSMVGLITR